MTTQQTVAVKISEDLCSSCSVCSSLCPFGAIKRDYQNGKMVLEIGKCQVCGLCYSTCPAKAIAITYYDVNSLNAYLEKARQEYQSNTLVIMCKGSTPDAAKIKKLFGVSRYIPLTVPCVGRIPEELFLKTLATGKVSSINVLACDEPYCRFDRGSAVAMRKIMALNLLLEQLGYGKNFINLKQNSFKVVADRDKCIRCGNCVFYCPFDAVKLESPEAASFDLDACMGCGLCAAVCPALALELENWEKERVSLLVSRLAAEMTKPKILVFGCQWSVLSPLNEGHDSNIRAIDLPCAASVDELHVIEAFQNGVDGVLVIACPDEDCKSKKGGKAAQRTVAALKKKLSPLGLQDKIHFCLVSPRYPETLAQELQQFKKKIETGPVKEAKK